MSKWTNENSEKDDNLVKTRRQAGKGSSVYPLSLASRSQPLGDPRARTAWEWRVKVRRTPGRTRQSSESRRWAGVTLLPPFLSHLQSSSPALKIPRGLLLPFGSLNTLIVAAPSNLSPTKSQNSKWKISAGSGILVSLKQLLSIEVRYLDVTDWFERGGVH